MILCDYKIDSDNYLSMLSTESSIVLLVAEPFAMIQQQVEPEA